MGTIRSTNTMKYYSSTKKAGDSTRALEYPKCNYTTETEDGRRSREKRDQRKRRKRRTHKESSRSHPRYSHSMKNTRAQYCNSSSTPKRHQSVRTICRESLERRTRWQALRRVPEKEAVKHKSSLFSIGNLPFRRADLNVKSSVDIDVDHWCEKAHDLWLYSIF